MISISTRVLRGCVLTCAALATLGEGRSLAASDAPAERPLYHLTGAQITQLGRVLAAHERAVASRRSDGVALDPSLVRSSTARLDGSTTVSTPNNPSPFGPKRAVDTGAKLFDGVHLLANVSSGRRPLIGTSVHTAAGTDLGYLSDHTNTGRQSIILATYHPFNIDLGSGAIRLLDDTRGRGRNGREFKAGHYRASRNALKRIKKVAAGINRPLLQRREHATSARRRELRSH